MNSKEALRLQAMFVEFGEKQRQISALMIGQLARLAGTNSEGRIQAIRFLDRHASVSFTHKDGFDWVSIDEVEFVIDDTTVQPGESRELATPPPCVYYAVRRSEINGRDRGQAILDAIKATDARVAELTDPTPGFWIFAAATPGGQLPDRHDLWFMAGISIDFDGALDSLRIRIGAVEAGPLEYRHERQRLYVARQAVQFALKAHGIEEILRGGLERYLVDGIMPGGFLQAVLENDLRGAIARSKFRDYTDKVIGQVMAFLRATAPACSWGCEENVDRWIRTSFSDELPKDVF